MEIYCDIRSFASHGTCKRLPWSFYRIYWWSTQHDHCRELGTLDICYGGCAPRSVQFDHCQRFPQGPVTNQAAYCSGSISRSSRPHCGLHTAAHGERNCFYLTRRIWGVHPDKHKGQSGGHRKSKFAVSGRHRIALSQRSEAPDLDREQLWHRLTAP